MEVLELTAAQLIKPMSTGRNRPLLLGCEDSTTNPFEVAVKFRGKEMDAKAQIAELVTAQLADDLGHVDSKGPTPTAQVQLSLGQRPY